MTAVEPSPDAVVVDIKVTLQDALAGPWLKRWLDIRTFLRQRRALLNDPVLTLDDEIRSDIPGWKTPLKFAFQGLVLPVVAVQVIGFILGVIFVRPPSYLKRLQSEAETALVAIKHNRVIVSSAPDDAIFESGRDLRAVPNRLDPTTATWGIYKIDYVRQLDVAKNNLETALKKFATAEHIQTAEKLLAPLAAPIAFILAAYAFRLFARSILAGSQRANHRRAHEVFLYLHTSAMFWANVVLIVTAALISSALIYTGIFDRTMFAAAHRGPLEAMITLVILAELQMLAALVASAPWLVWGWRRFIRDVRIVYGLPHVGIWRDSIFGAAFGANAFTFIVLAVSLNVGTWVYGHIVTFVEERKINIEAMSNPRGTT
jgi:hypothetical protein